ncbi:MAG: hypothetical protein HC785_07845 [Calothrix sp. CSU_2_0]|nr:hypothetical protein [Calothrix sp. CSU_2_0]
MANSFEQLNCSYATSPSSIVTNHEQVSVWLQDRFSIEYSSAGCRKSTYLGMGDGELGMEKSEEGYAHCPFSNF